MDEFVWAMNQKNSGIFGGSTATPTFVMLDNEPELWKQTEAMVQRVLDESKINYVKVPNEAAFYGPKIDVQARQRTGTLEFDPLGSAGIDPHYPKRLYFEDDHHGKGH